MNHQDLKTVVIHGKNPTRQPTIQHGTVKSPHHANTMNGAAIEKKIDDGTMTTPPMIPPAVSRLIIDHRVKTKVGDKTMTQLQLATAANQKGGRGILPKDITDMENGQMLVNHTNKLKIRAVQKALGIPHFDL